MNNGGIMLSLKPQENKRKQDGILDIEKMKKKRMKIESEEVKMDDDAISTTIPTGNDDDDDGGGVGAITINKKTSCTPNNSDTINTTCSDSDYNSNISEAKKKTIINTSQMTANNQVCKPTKSTSNPRTKQKVHNNETVINKNKSNKDQIIVSSYQSHGNFLQVSNPLQEQGSILAPTIDSNYSSSDEANVTTEEINIHQHCQLQDNNDNTKKSIKSHNHSQNNLQEGTSVLLKPIDDSNSTTNLTLSKKQLNQHDNDETNINKEINIHRSEQLEDDHDDKSQSWIRRKGYVMKGWTVLIFVSLVFLIPRNDFTVSKHYNSICSCYDKYFLFSPLCHYLLSSFNNFTPNIYTSSRSSIMELFGNRSKIPKSDSIPIKIEDAPITEVENKTNLLEYELKKLQMQLSSLKEELDEKTLQNENYHSQINTYQSTQMKMQEMIQTLQNDNQQRNDEINFLTMEVQMKEVTIISMESQLMTHNSNESDEYIHELIRWNEEFKLEIQRLQHKLELQEEVALQAMNSIIEEVSIKKAAELAAVSKKHQEEKEALMESAVSALNAVANSKY